MAYGWRARIGLILPMDNAVMEPEFYSLGLEGIAAHSVRLLTTEREQMPQAGIDASVAFNELGVDAIGYACAETSFLGGLDTNTLVSREIEKRTQRPAVTAIGAMVEALGAMRASTVAVAAPYRESSALALQEYLDAVGIRVIGFESEDFSARSSDSREWYETNLQPPATAYRMARQATVADVDAVVIAATNLRTFEIIPHLESDLGKPVISSNSALIWSLLRRCGVRIASVPLGQLWRGEHTWRCV